MEQGSHICNHLSIFGSVKKTDVLSGLKPGSSWSDKIKGFIFLSLCAAWVLRLGSGPLLPAESNSWPLGCFAQGSFAFRAAVAVKGVCPPGFFSSAQFVSFHPIRCHILQALL